MPEVKFGVLLDLPYAHNSKLKMKDIGQPSMASPAL